MPNIIKKIELWSTYRCFKIFKVEGVIFKYPSILRISLVANEAPLQKWKIKPEFSYSWKNPGGERGTATGSPPFTEEIEIPPLKPNECKQIKIRIDAMREILGLINPASLKLYIFNSEGECQGFKYAYPRLMNVEEVKEKIRNKVVFWVVILSFLLMIVSLFVSLSSGK